MYVHIQFRNIIIIEIIMLSSSLFIKINEANITSSVNCSLLTSENPCYAHLESFLKPNKSATNGDSSSPIYVKSVIDSSIISQNQELVNSFLSSDSTCKRDGLPLYCKFLYSPCTSVVEQFALTENECASLKSEYCKWEFSSLSILSKLQSEYLPLIPNCNTLEAAAATDQVCTYVYSDVPYIKWCIPFVFFMHVRETH